MFRTQNHLRAGFLALLLAVAPVPAQANDTPDCYRNVIKDCAGALEGGSWYERFAAGVICHGMLAGCVIESML